MRYIALLTLTFLTACKTSDTAPAPEAASPASAQPHPASPPATPQSEEKNAAPVEQAATAQVGEKAPDFELPDLSGKPVKLGDHVGKIIVLEWFNPGCPFVKAAHTVGSLVDTAARLQKKGVAYFAINSGAPGKQGHGKEANLAGKERFKLAHPVLLDETGRVGKAYGATNTPHVFVINAEGTLVYAGAVDNSPDGEGQSPQGGALVNYLTQVVDELEAGKLISVSETKAYGCSVKYDD